MRHTAIVPAPVPVLLLTGTVGAGKTAVAMEVSEILAERGVAHVALDIDAVSYVFPRPDHDPFGQQVALANLAAVWVNARKAGAERLVLARVIEDRSELDGFRTAVPAARITVCRITAPQPLVQTRLEGREIGSGRDWHLRRSGELSAVLDEARCEDIVVANDGRPVRAVAGEVLDRIGW